MLVEIYLTSLLPKQNDWIEKKYEYKWFYNFLWRGQLMESWDSNHGKILKLTLLWQTLSYTLLRVTLFYIYSTMIKEQKFWLKIVVTFSDLDITGLLFLW